MNKKFKNRNRVKKNNRKNNNTIGVMKGSTAIVEKQELDVNTLSLLRMGIDGAFVTTIIGATNIETPKQIQDFLDNYLIKLYKTGKSPWEPIIKNGEVIATPPEQKSYSEAIEILSAMNYEFVKAEFDEVNFKYKTSEIEVDVYNEFYKSDGNIGIAEFIVDLETGDIVNF